MEIYGRVRRAVRVEGRSQRAVTREFGLSRETVRKMLQYAVPPGYQRQHPIRRPKLGPWLGVIDAIVSDDKQRPADKFGRPAKGNDKGKVEGLVGYAWPPNRPLSNTVLPLAAFERES